MSSKKTKKDDSNIIILNKKARHDYFIEQTYEAGVSLEGWEVKSLRSSKVQIKESYVILKDNEMYLLGSHITPLKHSSTHVNADPVRTRKLLLHRKEIDKIRQKIEQKGNTVVPLKLFWSKNNKIKLEIGVAKGKKNFDKRQDVKYREWSISKERTLKNSNR